MEHVNENKPLRELAFALIGILLFVGLVLLIGVSAFLRPAGEHYVPEATEVIEANEVTEAAVEAPQVVNEPTNPTNQPDIPNEAGTVIDAVIVDETTATDAESPLGTIDTPEDASITPAMLPQEGTATAEGTVSQTGAQVVDDTAPAELTDGDVVGDADTITTDTIVAPVTE